MGAKVLKLLGFPFQPHSCKQILNVAFLPFRALLGLAVNSLQANSDTYTPSTYFVPRAAALLRSVSRLRQDSLLAYFQVREARNLSI
ncbi:hypothetical protein DEO72_LG6g403 [Vigna unguiculata]|uniref:Uncharacterized protein n=1 Tax=Vigna unguiculata TaxID=3917 RepID=A0A4D6M539_VIGUN|nr:hypothetical protein DEO72_LG6g403 [Vigna unguiculata]